MKCESAICVTLVLSSYFVLACVPLAVRWRWGLPVSLLVSIATVVLLFVVAKFGIERWLVTPLPGGIDCGDEGRGLDVAIPFFFLPAAATLAGAGLAVLWSIFAMWRRYAGRGNERRV
jgi:hypothetical protein